MPWPMVHFAISAEFSNGDPSPNLLLGSLAPDAIHVRGHVSREEKGVTHLVHNDTLPSKEVIMKRCDEYINKRSESEWKNFVLGYFSHIYTDLRWTETVYADFEKAYKGDISNVRRTYNQEVSQLEFNLMRSMDRVDNLFAKLLKANGYAIEPYVTQPEVIQYRDIKMNWLQDFNNEPRITQAYFQTDHIKDFISRTSNELKELFRGGYHGTFS